MSQVNAAIERFRQYLQIKTCHPNPEYHKCVEFLTEIAKELELAVQVHEFAAGFPVIIMSWQGSLPCQPSIILSSHYDVVPVSEEFWESDPFAAIMKPNGDIVARGAQDMKCVGMAYLEAIRRLKEANVVLEKSVHLIFTPDEEVGSEHGSALLIESEVFKKLNAGVVLDEGVPAPVPQVQVFNAERVCWCK